MDMLPAPPASYAMLPGSMESIARGLRVHLLTEAACREAYPNREWAPRDGSGVSAAGGCSSAVRGGAALLGAKRHVPSRPTDSQAPSLPLYAHLQILRETTTAMSVLRSVEIPWGATGASLPGTFSAGEACC